MDRLLKAPAMRSGWPCSRVRRCTASCRAAVQGGGRPQGRCQPAATYALIEGCLLPTAWSALPLTTDSGTPFLTCKGEGGSAGVV